MYIRTLAHIIQTALSTGLVGEWHALCILTMARRQNYELICNNPVLRQKLAYKANTLRVRHYTVPAPWWDNEDTLCIKARQIH